MRFRAILREAWRNTTTGSAAACRTAIVAAATVSLLAGADVSSTQQLAARADEFARSGASISIVTAMDRVDGTRCDRLAELPGVAAAGAVRSTSWQLVPTVLRRSPIPLSEASPGFVAVIGAATRSAGVLLGPEATEALGPATADILSTTSGTVRVGGDYPYPEDGRRPGLSYAALAPVLADRAFDECWIDSRPAQDMTAALLSTVLLGGDQHDPPAIAQLNPTLGVTFDGRALFAERISRFIGPCAALVGLVLGFVAVRSRRLALASALHAGASHSDLRGIVAAETVAWGIISAALAMPAVVLIGAGLESGAGPSLAVGITVMCSLWLSGFVGAWSGVLTVRERHLFRYFKDR
jgi:hypothetical protein